MGHALGQGHHQKSNGSRKTEVLRLRVTPDQKRVLVEAAERDELDFSNWARRLLLKAALATVPLEIRGETQRES